MLSEYYRVIVLERSGVPYVKPNLMTQEGFFLTTLIEVDCAEGSSAINAGFYSKAIKISMQDQGSIGTSEWLISPMNGLISRLRGLLSLLFLFLPELKNWQSSVRDGFLESGIDPYNGFSLEHLGGTKIGGSSSGKKYSAAYLLSYANPSNIKVAVV